MASVQVGEENTKIISKVSKGDIVKSCFSSLDIQAILTFSNFAI